MSELTEQAIVCPYCGETISVLLDIADVDQQYIEDCQICCKPITFKVYENLDSELVANVYHEDETF
jgi:transcription elongation factor Elf1